MQMHQLRPGMLVRHQGKIARVEKPKQKRVIVIHEDGGRWDAYPVNLEPAPADAVFNLKIDEAKGLTLGSAVRFKRGSVNSVRYPGLHVVTAVRAGNEYQIAKFGGSSGQYFPGVPASALEEVSVDDVEKILTGV